MNELRFTSFFKKNASQFAESIAHKPPFPVNVNVVTIRDLYEALKDHVSFLEEEKQKARKAKEKINSLKESEEEFVNYWNKVQLFKKTYETFWEEKVPENLEKRQSEIIQKYCEKFDGLIKESAEKTYDFSGIEYACKKVTVFIQQLNRDLKNIIESYEELFGNVGRYFKSGIVFVTRLEVNVLPKLNKSDKTKITNILNALKKLYNDVLNWIDFAFDEILNKNASPEISETKTIVLEKERHLRESLVKEIKDLDEEHTKLLMEIVKILADRKVQWASITEISEILAKITGKGVQSIKKDLLDIADKGFLTLGIGF